MRTIRQLAALAAAGALAGVPGLAGAQEIHPGDQGWLGLTGADIPEILRTVAADPYKAPAEPACETIPAEILALDRVLGADTGPDKHKTSYVVAYAGRQVKGAVRGLVPYRGVIRFLTGADKKDHELVSAAQAGWARRGFLRGLEANLRCAPQTQVAALARPAADTAIEVRRVETAYEADAAQGGAADRAAVMPDEPRESGLDKPGR